MSRVHNRIDDLCQISVQGTHKWFYRVSISTLRSTWRHFIPGSSRIVPGPTHGRESVGVSNGIMIRSVRLLVAFHDN